MDPDFQPQTRSATPKQRAAGLLVALALAVAGCNSDTNDDPDCGPVVVIADQDDI